MSGHPLVSKQTALTRISEAMKLVCRTLNYRHQMNDYLPSTRALAGLYITVFHQEYDLPMQHTERDL